jgi:hypothetical protein
MQAKHHTGASLSLNGDQAVASCDDEGVVRPAVHEADIRGSAMQWVGSPCILSNITLQNFKHGDA